MEFFLCVCNRCIEKNIKCVKVVIIVFFMDFESRNGVVKIIFEDKKINKIMDFYIKLMLCFFDFVYVGKWILCQFSNWYLIVDGQ